ncbi:MAG: glutamate racemase, partial [Hyphomonas sp.]|nr:glutamate racemase [Hyphomonas sp.]
MVEMLPGNFVPSPARGRVLVFDSGVGGLTVAEEIRALGPVLGVHYAADSGFFPYGDKSDEALRERLPKVAKALCDRVRPDVFVIACNTASTLALQDVRAALDIPVVGTVPAIKPAAQLTRTGTIGLLATPGT